MKENNIIQQKSYAFAKFKNKYRNGSHRRPNWDYSGNALYFLTIVTQHRLCILGRIIDGIMELSDMGKIVETEWHKSFDIRNELFLHDYVLMPNHLHTIVEIDNGGIGHHDMGIVGPNGRSVLQYPYHTTTMPTLKNAIVPMKRNMPVRLPKSISSFIAGFKSAVNTKIDDYIDAHQLPIPKYNRNNHFFQPNYHDHIIRNHFEYLRIKKYIVNNPLNWNKDTLR